jgi:hypothetical protein
VCLWAVAATLTAPAAAQTRDVRSESPFIEQAERFTPGSGAPIELRFAIAREVASQTTRVVNATHAALTLLSDWFGPAPFSTLFVGGLAWRPANITSPITTIDDRFVDLHSVSTRLRWLTTARDQSTERELISGIVRQYWNGATPSSSPFEDAVHSYVAMRAAHHQLEGSNFATLRFFGGVVPFSLRSVLLSPMVADSRPRVARFDDSTADTPLVARFVSALQTLERYVGWPTMLQTLAAIRAGEVTQQRFAAALSEIRGTDMRFLVDECFHFDTVFDYAVASLQSDTSATGSVETTVMIARHGPGMFATSAGGDRNPLMTMRVRFADGSEVRDVFDGTAPSVSRVYSAKTAAVSATVDPDVVLLLDVNRDNNTIIRNAPTARLGVRLALNWMTWLQQAMLSYTAIV